MFHLNEVEKLAADLKGATLQANSKDQHKHGGLTAEEKRKKYPADYDSSSDYEVLKLGELIKQVDEHKKTTLSTTQHQAHQIKLQSESLGRQIEEANKGVAELKAFVEDQIQKLQ